MVTNQEFKTGKVKEMLNARRLNNGKADLKSCNINVINKYIQMFVIEVDIICSVRKVLYFLVKNKKSVFAFVK